jgi:hypothetical protein
MTTKLAKFGYRLLFLLALLALCLGVSPRQAQAYGNTAIWQIGLSANCNNPDLCGDALGGFWGWVEFDQNGLGDATLAGCGHMVAAGPVHMAGADAFSVDIDGWTVKEGSAGPLTFFVTGGTMTFKGHGQPVTVPIDGELDTGIPAKAGHFNTTQLLGFSAPGVAYQIQVAKIPNR